jgi:hypothetical protein
VCAFDRALLIERLLPRRNLGDSLIDQALLSLFRDRAGGCAFKKLPLAALTFKPRLLIAQTAALFLLRGIIVLLALLTFKPGLLLAQTTALFLLRGIIGLLALLTFEPRLLIAQTTALFLLGGIIVLLALRIIAAGIAAFAYDIAGWRVRVRPRGVAPLGVRVPLLRQFAGRRLRREIAVEAAARIGRRRARASLRLAIPVARSPFGFAATFAFARSFAPIAALTRLIIVRERRRARLFWCALVEATFAIATTHAGLVGASPDLPLGPILIAITTAQSPLAFVGITMARSPLAFIAGATARSPLVVAIDRPAAVVLRIGIARIIRLFVAPSPRHVRPWRPIAIAN